MPQIGNYLQGLLPPPSFRPPLPLGGPRITQTPAAMVTNIVLPSPGQEVAFTMGDKTGEEGFFLGGRDHAGWKGRMDGGGFGSGTGKGAAGKEGPSAPAQKG